MNTKNFNGKIIHAAKGAALEYAPYWVDAFKGCSCGCTYCSNNRWKWGSAPVLKKGLEDTNHAIKVFESELLKNLSEYKEKGLCFSYCSDPMSPKTKNFTMHAIEIATWNCVNVKILTKEARWMIFNSDDFSKYGFWGVRRNYVAFGFTLTGHDELEPNASTNAERIEAMRKLHEAGFKTWASIEPIIDVESAEDMIFATHKFCDLYKIGLMSGYRKQYLVYSDKVDMHIGLDNFVKGIYKHIGWHSTSKIYFKDSLLKAAGVDRADLPDNCVSRDYNMFNH